MPLKITPVEYWVAKIEDRAGGAARALGPLAGARVNLEFVLARRTPEEPGRGVLYVAPVKGGRAEEAARAAGLSRAADLAGLRVEGDNRAGAGHAMADALGQAGISFRGLAASVLGRKYVCYFAFDREEDARRAAEVLKAAGRKQGKPPARGRGRG
ncbi:MAG TPA: amino acid-binding protein [Planctomycetota bacterium]|nr:amino acid-binding protein [Planctomycetota bacterium]